ncbi:trypsin-like serine peptidase [Streptomyces mutomycini]|uniref:Trypsin-like serine peptidase n=1 Tax=Streptomyces mutomycini TaxID=284036 RepID=A0ABW0B3Z3_9ACTN|nr:serine protease [Streptomyces mutomycini]
MAITADFRSERLEQADAAAERYRSTSAERQHIERQLKAGVRFPDSPAAIAARAARLLDRQEVPTAAAVESVREEPLDAPAANERILGLSKELQAWSFLPRGARAARTVARISIRENGRELPAGTGFMVSPQLLMTNHHVLPDETAAQQCVVEFDAHVTIDNAPAVPVRMELDPGSFFVADERLDFALVLVQPLADGRRPGEVFGWNRLSAQLGKLVVGEPVNVIGHPMGRLKEITVRDNALLVRLDDFLQYRADTQQGNSGSPVYNDQWEVVALHHSGVPEKDAQGRTLRKDGAVWQPGDGDDAISWVANEGARTSSILRHLASLQPGAMPQLHPLLSEMGPEAGLQGVPTAPRSLPGVSLPGPDGASTAPPAREAAVGHVGLRARETAFGGDRHLVFLHGRSQQEKDPQVLRRCWSAGLNHGLTCAGMQTVDPADVWFPYYGNELIQAVEQHESVPRSFEERAAGRAAETCAPAGPARSTYEELVAEAAGSAGMPREDLRATEAFGSAAVGALQRQLSWLAAKTDVDEWFIATTLRDVAAYLTEPSVRETVLDTVLATMPTSGELLLVTHSLGTVVGMDLIDRLAPGPDIRLLVTAGSPLGLDAVYRRLLTGGAKRPERVAAWVNAWCPTDGVAIGCPLGDDWKGELTELAVTNARDRAHDIGEYLTHPEVAARIGSAVAAGGSEFTARGAGHLTGADIGRT